MTPRLVLIEWEDSAHFDTDAVHHQHKGDYVMKGDMRCIEGRLWRHDPQHDDPDLETDVGQCPDCSGDGCGDDGESVSKAGRSATWAR